MELEHLELKRLGNNEAVSYTMEWLVIIALFPNLQKALAKSHTPFKVAVQQAVDATTKIDLTGITANRKEKHLERGSNYLRFRGIIESGMQSNEVAERSAALKLVRTIRLHGWRMQSKPADKFSTSLTGLIGALKDPELVEAIALVGADKAYAALIASQVEFEKADALCIKARAENKKISPTKALKQVGVEFTKLATAIEGLLLTSDDPQLEDMVKQLNVLTQAKRATVRGKATRLENARKDMNAPKK